MAILAVAWWTLGQRLRELDHPEVVGTVTIEPGDTLWDLSSDLRGDQPRQDWIQRTCELNEWGWVPVLQVGWTISVPDWRDHQAGPDGLGSSPGELPEAGWSTAPAGPDGLGSSPGELQKAGLRPAPGGDADGP